MKIILTVLAAMLLMIACGRNSKQADHYKMNKNTVAGEEPAGQFKSGKENSVADTTIPYTTDQEQRRQKQPSSSSTADPDWDKKIIKNASLDFEIKDFKGYYARLREKVKGLGGYVAQEEQNQDDYRIENILTLKIPADQFDNALAVLTNEVEKLNEKKITSQDVTGEYIDTKSRIEAKKQVRQRYMDLLKQAGNMEEILNVQSEINEIQEEIESATGRISYLGHAAAFSTISLTYYQVLDPSAKDNREPGWGTKLGSAFRSGWNWTGELFVGLVSVWPLFLLISVVIIILKRTRIQKPKQA